MAGRSALIQSDFTTKFVTIYLDSRRVAECIIPSFIRDSDSYLLSSDNLTDENEEFSNLLTYLIDGVRPTRARLPQPPQVYGETIATWEEYRIYACIYMHA